MTTSLQTLRQLPPNQAKAWLNEVIDRAGPLAPSDVRAGVAALVALPNDTFGHAVQTDPSLPALFASAEVNAPAEVPAAPELPVVQGTLVVDRGGKPVVGEQGYREWPKLKMSVTTADGRSFEIQSDHDTRKEIFGNVPGTDVMAFDGREVSLRGWLDPSGKVLRVTEFSPGNEKDFVSGRVIVKDGAVYVRARGRGDVEVTDPDLKRQLSTHPNLGVILSGEVTSSGGGVIPKLVYAGKPDNYWMLVRFTEEPKKSDTKGIFVGQATAATSKTSSKIFLPKEQVEQMGSQDPLDSRDRLYVFGHFGEKPGVIEAIEATPSAGSPWLTADAPRGAPMKTVLDLT